MSSIKNLDHLITCQICHNHYDKFIKIPKQLPCQHVFCSPCINMLYENQNIECPNDKKNFKFDLFKDIPNSEITLSLLGTVHSPSKGFDSTLKSEGNQAHRSKKSIIEIWSLKDQKKENLKKSIDIENKTEIDLSDCELVSLENKLFNGLINLEGISLTSNKLNCLPNGIFNTLSNLTWLIITNNELTSLPNGIFNGLSNLKTINLDNNKLTTLPNGVFNKLNSLERISLNNNRLTTLQNNIFNGLSSLQWIWLENNFLIDECQEKSFYQLFNHTQVVVSF